jgi:hypothetical protein
MILGHGFRHGFRMRDAAMISHPVRREAGCFQILEHKNVAAAREARPVVGFGRKSGNVRLNLAIKANLDEAHVQQCQSLPVEPFGGRRLDEKGDWETCLSSSHVPGN